MPQSTVQIGAYTELYAISELFDTSDPNELDVCIELIVQYYSDYSAIISASLQSAQLVDIDATYPILTKA